MPHLLKDVADQVGVGELEHRKKVVGAHDRRVDLDRMVQPVPALLQELLRLTLAESDEGGKGKTCPPSLPDDGEIMWEKALDWHLLLLDFVLDDRQLQQSETPHGVRLSMAGGLRDLHLALLDLRLLGQK